MLYSYTIQEIKHNINTGIEYEIALFYKLLATDEQGVVLDAINSRSDKEKVMAIIEQTDIQPILNALSERGVSLLDVSFETQNDEVGPADIVMHVESSDKQQQTIGISVKYANSCSLNVTGRRFITDNQIAQLKEELPRYTNMYIKDMEEKYGEINNWFRTRKTSTVTDSYIDLIRDAVIATWPNVENKTSLLSALFHSDSPIEFWVVTFNKKGYSLKTKPTTVEASRAEDIAVRKHPTSYVGFYLDDTMIGCMQIKFNNGFIEKCKKRVADVEHQGVKMSYGQPFSSWNFSIED
jgi:hypothetical protein